MSIKFSVLSLFPEQVETALSYSMTARAMERGLLELKSVQIRDFAVNDYGQVDDAPYGGGRGMVLMCDPVYRAWRFAQEEAGDRPARTFYLSPAGRVFDQDLALTLSKESHLILICGHYEGLDRRVIDEIGAEELSIGNFVLTGGELAAAVIIDAISRLVPGVLPDEEAWKQDSFAGGLLEWPQYTRPPVWRGREVPPVLLSGHQARIDRERLLSQVLETLQKKAWLLKDQDLDLDLWEELAKRILTDKGVCED